MAFGDFTSLCSSSAIPVCYLLGPPTTLTSLHNPLLLPSCSARSIEFANTIIFQAATDFAHLAALFMTAIMIFHVRSKFTAVGRKEILTFFYVYVLLTVVSLVLDAGVLGSSDVGAFLYFVAVQNGLASALCTSLLVNGFVGFQLYEDGTFLSVWLLRVSSAGMFAISFMVSLLTFKGWGGLSPTNTTGLFVVLFVINAICVAVYLVMQVILVVNTLQDRWPLWDLAAAVFFFVVGQVILYSVGSKICEAVNHYLDGLFFATMCNLLAVMMVYKYWDSITKEDLEFSVGTKQNNWDLAASKDPLLETDIQSLHRNSLYGVPTGRESVYDASSLDYRPVSHGDAVSRGGYQHQGPQHQLQLANEGYAGSGYAGNAMESGGRRDHNRSSYGYQHANNSGSLTLLERRASYGQSLREESNRKSMQVHTGVAEDEEIPVPQYEYRDDRVNRQSGSGADYRQSGVDYRQSGSHARAQSQGRERYSRGRRESEREFAY